MIFAASNPVRALFVPTLALGLAALSGCVAPSAGSPDEASATPARSAATTSLPTCLNGVAGLPVLDGPNFVCKIELPVNDANRAKIVSQTFGALKNVVFGGTFQLPATFEGIGRILQEKRIEVPMQEAFATLDLGRGGMSTVSVVLAPSVELEGAGFCDIHATKANVGVVAIHATFLPTWGRDGVVRVLNDDATTGQRLVDAFNGALDGARKNFCH